MVEDSDAVVCVLVEPERCLLSTTLDYNVALTIIATVSDDPSDWSESQELWSRYRTPGVCEFPGSVCWTEVDRRVAHGELIGVGEWVVIDFVHQRVLTGPEFMELGRDACLSLTSNGGEKGPPMSIHLPPWWEFRGQVGASALEEPRGSLSLRRCVDRDVLYEKGLLEFIAARVLAKAASDDWMGHDAAETPRIRYAATIEIHRDWLMTPRHDLGGRIPRELLHGAQEWSEQVVWGQRMRFDAGWPLVATPDHWGSYAAAPMGNEEIIVYFDMCRELISAGWAWCAGEGRGRVESADQSRQMELLVDHLREVRDTWLASPFEEGAAPNFVIECSRRRVPRGVGVPIEGMSGVEPHEHMIDCDCPICGMMAEGKFGVSFIALDGHHLELDGEFAFSMFESRSEFQSMQGCFGAGDCEDSEEDLAILDDDENADSDGRGVDELASSWSGVVSDTQIPGDSKGHLKLAFLLAEVISELQDHDAPQATIRELNAKFTKYRSSDQDSMKAAADGLKDVLQELAVPYPDLISRIADFQSRVDEQLRACVRSGDWEVPY